MTIVPPFAPSTWMVVALAVSSRASPPAITPAAPASSPKALYSAITLAQSSDVP
ncbi:MAG: hypothetical protein WD156_06095 [Acidimicrobiia bacterium]